MEAIAGIPVFGIIASLSLIRVLLRTWQNKEKESGEERPTVFANTGNYGAETQGEKMSPNYLPPPNAAGNENDKNQKGDMK